MCEPVEICQVFFNSMECCRNAYYIINLKLSACFPLHSYFPLNKNDVKFEAFWKKSWKKFGKECKFLINVFWIPCIVSCLRSSSICTVSRSGVLQEKYRRLEIVTLKMLTSLITGSALQAERLGQALQVFDDLLISPFNVHIGVQISQGGVLAEPSVIALYPKQELRILYLILVVLVIFKPFLQLILQLDIVFEMLLGRVLCLEQIGMDVVLVGLV